MLVRLFVNDDAAQAERARALFDAQAETDDSLWIADVVLAELVWALDRSYGRPRGDIVTVLRALAGNAPVLLESAGCIGEATSLYERAAGGLCRLPAGGEGPCAWMRGAAQVRQEDEGPSRGSAAVSACLR